LIHVAKKAPKPPKAEKAPKPPKEPADRSAAVAVSWTDPEVAAARCVKSKVKVDGVEYGSVLKAFIALQLPVNKHIGFRAKLKASGNEVFKHEHVEHNFVLVTPEQEAEAKAAAKAAAKIAADAAKAAAPKPEPKAKAKAKPKADTAETAETAPASV